MSVDRCERINNHKPDMHYNQNTCTHACPTTILYTCSNKIAYNSLELCMYKKVITIATLFIHTILVK